MCEVQFTNAYVKFIKPLLMSVKLKFINQTLFLILNIFVQNGKYNIDIIYYLVNFSLYAL